MNHGNYDRLKFQQFYKMHFCFSLADFSVVFFNFISFSAPRSDESNKTLQLCIANYMELNSLQHVSDVSLHLEWLDE